MSEPTQPGHTPGTPWDPKAHPVLIEVHGPSWAASMSHAGYAAWIRRVRRYGWRVRS